LWDIAFGVWRLDFHNCAEEGSDLVNILVCGVWLNINEVDGQWFVCVALLYITYVCRFVTFFL
jgi:hypothetical protein